MYYYRAESGQWRTSHGNYIRPVYRDVWTEAKRQAERDGVSLSEFVNRALFTFMTGQDPVKHSQRSARKGRKHGPKR